MIVSITGDSVEMADGWRHVRSPDVRVQDWLYAWSLVAYHQAMGASQPRDKSL